MAGYIRYANQNATRNQELNEDLLKRLSYLQDMGITAEVFSGGQPGKEEGGARVGSTRHDHGHAADVFFYKDGKKLDWANPDDLPIFEQIVSQGKANGVTGFGAGPDYMQPGSMHIGMGNPGVWGAGGSSKTAPEWLRNAYNGASSGKVDPIAEVIAAADPNAKPSVGPDRPFAPSTATTETASTDKPKSRNGILVEAYNKLTNSDVQMPGTILGIETDKLTAGAGKLGDFAKTLTENDAALNNQIAAANRGGGRSMQPVEISFLSSLPPKKKKGSLSGLGGFVI